VIGRVVELIGDLGRQDDVLGRYGLTAEEFAAALPVAIERMRGSASASNADRRHFLATIFQSMLGRGLISALAEPEYGDDTVYRLTLHDGRDIAVIQKGCPDGAHSATRWLRPPWAAETYLWWLCSSVAHEPGEHVAKGVNRLRQRFFSEAPGTVDGIIFHNQLCGTPQRPCPKAAHSAQVAGWSVPPPCIYVMPGHDEDRSEWNWNDEVRRDFPAVLLSLFEIDPARIDAYIGYVGFRSTGDGGRRTTLTSRFGSGRSTTHRS
jgi:hypothetical protein